jgi:hypothetical protein
MEISETKCMPWDFATNIPPPPPPQFSPRGDVHMAILEGERELYKIIRELKSEVSRLSEEVTRIAAKIN